MSLDVHNHLLDGGRDKTDISHGKDGEKQIHGGKELRVQADGQDDEQIPLQDNQVYEQKELKEQRLKFQII